MRKIPFAIRIVLALMLLLPAATSSYAHEPFEPPAVSDYVPGQVLVKFHDGITPVVTASGVDLEIASLNTMMVEYGVTDAIQLFPEVAGQGLDRIYKLLLPTEGDVLGLVAALSGEGSVEYAEPNHIHHTLGIASDAPAATATLRCDPSSYTGIQHCTDNGGTTQVFVVDLKHPLVRVQTVLSGRNGIECNSVNHKDKDATSNCDPPYPLETVPAILTRYAEQDAVVAINADYFGCGTAAFPCGGTAADHGAQGLAVRQGIRLDGSAHGVTNNLAADTPSLAISASKIGIIGIPGSQSAIDAGKSSTYFNAIGGSPLIVKNSAVVVDPCRSERYHPYGDTCSSTSQTAAALTADGQLILITAAMNAENLASYLVQHFKVTTALKLDGGGSSQVAWLDGAGEVQTVAPTGQNRPIAEALVVFSQPLSEARHMPNDPQFSSQWGHDNRSQTGGRTDADIDVPEAWAATTGSRQVMVAVIDTGIDYKHEELDDGRVRTDIDKDWVNNDADAIDDQGHGTHVAGTIAAETNNGVGVAGIMWQGSLLPLKVCDRRGSCNADYIADAVRYAADKGAKVINMSLGGSCSQTIADAVNYAYFDKGVVIVAAAGNEGGSISYPARHEPVIAVGAVDHNDARAYFSNYGPDLDVAAPGVTIFNTVPRNGYDTLSGTSMAAPHVAGVAGLLLSYRPSLTNGQVHAILRNSADDIGQGGFDNQYGYGRVNAYRALVEVAPTALEPAKAVCSGCGASAAVAGVSDGNDILTNLRAVRDQVFQEEPGRRWTQIYYKHQFEVAWLILADAEVRMAAADGFQAFNPVFHRLADPAAPAVVLTPELIHAADRALMGVANRASTQVHDEIVQEWQRVAPDRFVGVEVREVWAQLRAENGSAGGLFLPSLHSGR